MKLAPEIIEMIENNETEKVFHTNAQDKRVIIKFFENSDLFSIYEKDEIDEYDTLNVTTTKFIALANKKDFNIIYCLPSFVKYGNSLRIKEFTEIDEKEINKLTQDIRIKIGDIILEKLSALETEVLEKIDLSKYEKTIEQMYKHKGKMKNPFHNHNYTLTPSFINAYFNNEELFKKKAADLITQKIFKEYEDYVGQKYALLNYEKSLMSDPKSILAKNLCDLINDEKYKSFTVHYKIPNGMILTEKINKQLASNRDIKKTIIERGNMCRIPIVSIQKITWGKNEIFNINNYPEIKISEEDYKFEFAKAGGVADLSNDDYKNKSLMKKVLVDNIVAFKYLDAKLKIDPVYLLELAEALSHPSQLEYLYKQLPNNLVIDQTFMIDFLTKGLKESVSTYSAFPNEIKKRTLVKSYNNRFYNLLLEKFGLSNKGLIEAIPEDYWKTSFAIEFCKNYTQDKLNIIDKIKNQEDFKIIFSDEEVGKYIDLIDDGLMKDKFFLLEYLSKPILIHILTKNRNIIEEYRNDEDVKKLIIKHIPNQLAATNYLEVTKKAYDSAEYFKLTSENIIFFNNLSQNDKEVFLDGELFDKTEITIGLDGNLLAIYAPNSVYKISGFGDILIADYEGHITRPTSSTFMISSKLLDLLKEIYPDCNSKNFKTIIKDIIKLETAKKEDIER